VVGMAGEADEKLAILVDRDLPVGLIANTAGVLALTLGRCIEHVIGPDTFDGSGERHVGITTMTLPILATTAEALPELRKRASELGLLVVDFCDAAQETRAYPDYTARLAATPEPELRYLGIAVFGPKRLVNRLAGSLPLLR
jgi:hypothetical protein